MRLLDYIQGARKGKEAHRLEKEAMRDPFLADAMDGYNSSTRNQERRIEELQRLVRGKSKEKKKYTTAWSIAASLFIVVGIGSYFLFQKDPLTKKGEEIALESERTVPPVEYKEDVLATVTQEDTMKATSPLIAKNREPEVLASVPISDNIAFEDTDIEESNLSLEIKPNPVATTKPVALREVRGKVTDQKGEPIVGASVSVKGTTNGTITDPDGNFVLNTGGNEELQVGFIGYDPVELPADTTKNMLIAMYEDAQTLDEVVVVGYGIKKKTSTAGSVRKTTSARKPQPVVGMKEFQKYLKENLIQPEDDECANEKGKVILTFQVDEDGRPDSITVKKSLCPSLDEEAIRLIEDGPAWTVGNEAAEITIRF